MKSIAVQTLIVFFILNSIESNTFLFSQNFTEGLKACLSLAEKNKFLEGEALEYAGNSKLLTNSSAAKANSNHNLNSRASVASAIRELDALVFLVFSNKQKFDVLDNELENYHNRQKGTDREFTGLDKIEKEIYDSISLVVDLRNTSDREKTIMEKVPLLQQAENLEKRAILRMEKILYTYFIQPAEFDIKWIISSNLSDPYIKVKSSSGIVNASFADTSYQVHLDKAMKIFNIMDITEPQLDFFNEFLSSKFPLNGNGIDFMKVAYSNLDTLKDQWQDYLLAGGSSSNSSISGLLSRISKSNNTSSASQNYLNSKSTSVFQYKIQISASREKLSKQFLESIYRGSEKIDENLENEWFKYTIGNFKSYREARLLRDKLNINGAFIVAYLNGKRIEISTYQRIQVVKPVMHEIGIK